ncbi:hypothetical protein KY339_00790 [Candidatus Woesearchaeota archaeon]|nr:hypothetical protein [Candidatus Woesearchaeota archaeon]
MKQSYEKLRKEYPGLPEFDELNREFEVSVLEDTDFLLSDVRKKITEKLEFFQKVLECIFQPEPTICNLSECKGFGEEEKTELFEVYKKIMVLTKDSQLASIRAEEKEHADFTISVFKDWKKIKQKMIYVLDRMKSSWKSETTLKDELGYLG